MPELLCQFCGAEQEMTDYLTQEPTYEIKKWECEECGKAFKWRFYRDVEVVEDDHD